MDHISKIIPEIKQQLQKVPAHNNSLAVSKPIWVSVDDEDRRIVELKYQSKQVGAMNDVELLPVAKKLILQIHVITGWTIPENEVVNILVDEFTKKLREDYPNMNPDEITYAFRKDTQVQDWGKAMNLSLIDKVLLPYLTRRKQISHEVEERQKPPIEKKYTPEQLENMQRQWSEEYYQRIRGGRIEPVPDYTREIMVKDGYIEKLEQADRFFVYWLNSGKENLYIKQE